MQDNEHENEERGHYLVQIFLMIISFVLLVVDSIEMYNTIKTWEIGLLIISPIYDNCLKWELYTKTVFLCFSLCLNLSCVCLTILLLDIEKFIEKYLSSYLYFNYMVFGPYMLAFCFLGLVNWGSVVYICDKQNLGNKVLSSTNMFYLIGCTLISAMILGSVSVYKTTSLYEDSILRKPEGSVIIRKMFWWIVFRNKEPVEFVRNAQAGNNLEQNRNIENNNNVQAEV